MNKILSLLSLLTVCLAASAVELPWDDRLAVAPYHEVFQGESHLCGVSIRFPVFEIIEGDELRAMLPALQALQLCDSLQLQISRGFYRKQPQWSVSFYPFIYRRGHYYRLTGFDWKPQYDQDRVLQEDNYACRASFASLRSATPANDASRYAANSVLSQGSWRKLSVTENGVYRITYDQLKKMGIDPAKAQIYGYGGHLLAEDFSDASRIYYDDLPPVAMYRNDKDRYILFYANGLQSWVYNSARKMYTRELNHYSNKACYFITESGGQEQLLMQEAPAITASVTASSRCYTDFILHETDRVNLGNTGRECFGESFVSNSRQSFSFDLGDYALDTNSQVLIEFVARNSVISTLQAYMNGESLGRTTFSAISASDSHQYGYMGNIRTDFKPQDTKLDIILNYLNGGQTPVAANLDKITLNVRKPLQGGAQPVLLFRDPTTVAAGACVEYHIAGVSENHIVLDLSDAQHPAIVPVQRQGDSLSFRALAGELKEYALVNLKASLPSPKDEGKLAAQNLHGLGSQDLVILTHSDFLEEAETLAQAHRDYSNLRCTVVDAQLVFNEFSSGTPDATAYRRFMKMFYDRATSEEDQPKLLLLFGDGVYDNRLITTTFSYSGSQSARLLTFQSEESLAGTRSYVSDDYFAMLDDTEGANLERDVMDIGVGRFPVRNKAEAQIAINKSINYLKNKDHGPWKNTVCFLADDGDNNTHITHADALADLVGGKNPEFIVNKIYVDAYNRENSASGEKVPDANRRLDQLLTSGLLMLNYSGHGSTTSWTAEGLLSITDIKEMKNTRLPLWVTATCDFSRYDDSESSGGELVFLNENGGAIAMVTTTRVVYSGPNFNLNKAFINQVFSKENGRRLSLGETLCRTKQSSTLYNDRNKLNFALIGDPALKLSFPEYRIRITAIDSIEIDPTHPRSLKALSHVSMQGEILDTEGQLAQDFDGIVYPSVFDSEETAHTLGNGGNEVFSYQERNKTLYSGKASVKQGKFHFDFILPKDLSYSNKSGLVNLYAYSDNTNIEAQGLFDGFLLGGSDETAARDSLGPGIRLFLNDTLFVNGGKCNTKPTLIAILEDVNGLNTSGNSIGHDLMLTIDGKDKYNLNSYYESDIDSYACGRLSYNLPELEEGKHTLTLKAWDMQNNSSEQSLSFTVVKGYRSRIFDLLFHQDQESAYFEFTHDRPQVWIEATLSVYDLSGRLQWQEQVSMLNKDNLSEKIEWNYVGSNGRPLANGLYICRLNIRSNDNEEAVFSRKIMLCR